MDATTWSRFQFGFLATFHYLFPMLTMGLALILFIFKLIAYKRSDPAYDEAARFWSKIFGINFVVGVVTGIPLEFQFGTNWAQFSNYAGGVIGLTLALEGMFAFFAESAFLGLFLFGEKRLSKKGHLVSAFMVFLGSWLSGYFIIATNAFMQRPVGYSIGNKGVLQLSDMWGYLFNPWAGWQYFHNMTSSTITAAFVVCAVGAYYRLAKRHDATSAVFLKVGTITAFIASIVILFPTGDMHGKMLAKYQPASLAAMEGKFDTSDQAELALIGQPDVANRRLDNALTVPVLSYLAYGSFGSQVKGMNDFPADQLPDNVELLYFAYHIMAGLGTIFILLTLISVIKLARRTLVDCYVMHWIWMLAFPLPYIATTMGWTTAELGRQPWLVYGLLRTSQGGSPTVPGGSVAFSALGFMGLYLVLGVLFLYLVLKQVDKGPNDALIPAKV